MRQQAAKKKNPPIFKYEIDVVGLGFRMKREFRQRFAKELPIPVDLVREQTNRFDINAIKVVSATSKSKQAPEGTHLGYIRAESAALLAPLMDNREDGGMVFKSAKLTGLYEDDDNRSGLLAVEFGDYRSMAPTL